MMDSNPEYGRFEQIVSQFLLKTLQIVLECRIPSLRPQDRSGDLLSNSRVKKTDKWFNLALGDRPAALEKLQFWHRNVLDPMVIDIIIVRRDDQDLSNGGVYHREGTVVERWVVQYENNRLLPVHSGDISSLSKKMYQKSIILFRCLYTMMRLLPAYKIFGRLSSLSQGCDIDVVYKVSSFGDPFSREEESMMKQYSFHPVEAPNGKLCVSVSYRSDLSDFHLESSASFPPVIIPNYVGSPAIDPLRTFSSLEKGSNAKSFSLRGSRPPSSMPSERPRSWSGGTSIHGITAYMQNQPFTESPPVYYGSSAPIDDPFSPSNIQGQRVQNHRMPHSYLKNVGNYESVSPPFSPISSPSPPTQHFSPSHNRSRLRPESAPMAIPHPMLNRSPRYLSPNLSDPSRMALPPPSPRNTKPDSSPHGSPSPSGNRLSRKLELSRPGESYTAMLNQSLGPKVSKDSKDESGRLSGLLSSGSSPRKTFSRSSSKLSFQDDLDIFDFSCPFDVDDVDASDSQPSQSLDSRKGSEFNSALSLGRKSQDAAVGALVHMLRTAPPLRQDSSCYSTRTESSHQEGGNFGTATGFFMPRKAADALEELKTYRDMKDLLLSKSGTHVFCHEDSQALPLDNIKGI